MKTYKILIDDVVMLEQKKTEDGIERVIKHVSTGTIGTVSKGWLRLGGEQWVCSCSAAPQFGDKKLANVYRQFRRVCERRVVA